MQTEVAPERNDCSAWLLRLLSKDFLIGVQRCAGGANQLVCFEKNVMVFRLLFGKEADGDKGRTKHQAHQHYFAVRAFVGVMK
jgi:hypothetical protein